MPEFKIHPQLRADCHYLGALDQSHLLLHNNAAVFWLILVPETDVTDLHDMDMAQYQQTMLQVKTLAGFLKHYNSADKINIAAIGNIVPQLHIHIIARSKDDPCWPDVVWGNLDALTNYTEEQVEEIRYVLARTYETV